MVLHLLQLCGCIYQPTLKLHKSLCTRQFCYLVSCTPYMSTKGFCKPESQIIYSNVPWFCNCRVTNTFSHHRWLAAGC
jgi:hypothetical protein